MTVVPVVLSGGAGSRLWPLSREHYPKQLIALAGEHTLLQATARRISSLEGVQAPIVVCGKEHAFTVAEQLRALDVTPTAILAEPEGRNTAPAIAAGALEALARHRGDPVLVVLPADHVIRNDARFAAAVRHAVREAAAGRLAALGVAATRAETGYGYIRAGRPTGVSGQARFIESFVEKPDAERAAAYLAAGGHYWNSGIFVFGAARYLRELGARAPLVCEAVRQAHERAERNVGFLDLHAESFAKSPAISVDYAVMEHTSDAVMVPLDADWSDAGSWAALSAFAEEDETGNVVQGDVILEGARNTYVRGDGRMMAVVGAADLVVVDTADAVLVAHKEKVQDVGKVVERLKRVGRDEYRRHRKVLRPWGSYEPVRDGQGFKVKHITVQPGQRLSLQVHRHRAEHWVVVRGAARVTRGDETFTLAEDRSTYIPQGVAHRLENPGAAPLEIIEVQMGSYLGEDDIVRLDDMYGRAAPEPSRSEA